MGKKNKSPKKGAVVSKGSLDSVEHKGGSVIHKAKEQAHLKGKGAQDNKKAALDEKPKVTDEQKLQDISLSLAKKRNRRRNKKKGGNVESKSEGSPSPTKEKEGSPQQNGDKEETISKLSKREKNRVKSKMSKDIAIDGKSKLGLADPKLIARQLKRLKDTTEPLSKNKQRKLLLLEKLHQKLQKDDKTKTPNTTASSDLSADDEVQSSSASATNKTVNVTRKAAKKAQDKLFLFVGNLSASVTDEMIRELFEPTCKIEKIVIQSPKRKRAKRYAFIKLADDENKQKALKLHGAMLADKKITVMFSDRSKGKKELANDNAELKAERNTDVEGNADKSVASGASPKKKNKNKKNKNKNGAKVSA